jgi:hypothetical protein
VGEKKKNSSNNQERRQQMQGKVRKVASLRGREQGKPGFGKTDKGLCICTSTAAVRSCSKEGNPKSLRVSQDYRSPEIVVAPDMDRRGK